MEEKLERRRGPSTYSISFMGIIAVAGLAASGVAAYNAVEREIAELKRAVEQPVKENYSCELVKK